MPSSRTELTAAIETAGIVAILRAPSDRGLVDACRAMADGGLRVAEVPLTTPNALAVVETIDKELGDRILIGTGSVLGADDVQRSADAGARFIVSPITKPEVIQTSHALDLPCLPGALTPTEVQAAWELGGDIIKVFPAHRLGGPAYIRELLAPLPHLKLMPTGGVRLDSAGEWIKAGAVCLGVGTSIFRPDLVEAGDWQALTEHTRAFVQAVRAAQQGKTA
jgi:2-dehydro-3-deoxyphosphogluconate aldolase / (4S)-4-hydroxy-2-oxoglutarate aldolase